MQTQIGLLNTQIRNDMNIRTIWLMFMLLAILAIFIPTKLKAEVTYTLQCDHGLCIVSQSVLEQLVNIIDHWKKRAETCKSV